MKKLIYTLIFAMTGNVLPAQLGVSFFGNIATPGALLSKSTYSPIGGGGGMGFLYRFDLGSFNIDAGIDGQGLVMGSKTYHFGSERDQFYNAAASGNIYARLVYNEYPLKPYFGVFTGGLLTSVNEKYYMVGEEENGVDVTLMNNKSYSQGFSFGFLYEIHPMVDLEIGAAYARGSEGVSYFDFSSASADSKYVNYQISSAQNYDMWMFKLGVVIFFDPGTWTCGSDYEVSDDRSQCNSGGGFRIFNNWNWGSGSSGSASSHGRINGHGKVFK